MRVNGNAFRQGVELAQLEPGTGRQSVVMILLDGGAGVMTLCGGMNPTGTFGARVPAAGDDNDAGVVFADSLLEVARDVGSSQVTVTMDETRVHIAWGDQCRSFERIWRGALRINRELGYPKYDYVGALPFAIAEELCERVAPAAVQIPGSGHRKVVCLRTVSGETVALAGTCTRLVRLTLGPLGLPEGDYYIPSFWLLRLCAVTREQRPAIRLLRLPDAGLPNVAMHAPLGEVGVFAQSMIRAEGNYPDVGAPEELPRQFSARFNAEVARRSTKALLRDALEAGETTVACEAQPDGFLVIAGNEEVFVPAEVTFWGEGREPVRERVRIEDWAAVAPALGGGTYVASMGEPGSPIVLEVDGDERFVAALFPVDDEGRGLTPGPNFGNSVSTT